MITLAADEYGEQISVYGKDGRFGTRLGVLGRGGGGGV